MMTKEIFQQLLAVRDSGYCNMFDPKAVQRYAYDHDWYELVVYIDENKKEYLLLNFPSTHVCVFS